MLVGQFIHRFHRHRIVELKQLKLFNLCPIWHRKHRFNFDPSTDLAKPLVSFGAMRNEKQIFRCIIAGRLMSCWLGRVATRLKPFVCYLLAWRSHSNVKREKKTFLLSCTMSLARGIVINYRSPFTERNLHSLVPSVVTRTVINRSSCQQFM